MDLEDNPDDRVKLAQSQKNIFFWDYHLPLKSSHIQHYTLFLLDPDIYANTYMQMKIVMCKGNYVRGGSYSEGPEEYPHGK